MHPLFRFRQSDDPELIDSEYVLRSNERITVQICALTGPSLYAVTESGQTDPDAEETFWIVHHGTFTDLGGAFSAALIVSKALPN